MFFSRDDKAQFASDGAPNPVNPDLRQVDGAIYAASAQLNVQALDAVGQVVGDSVAVHDRGVLALGG